MFLLPVLVIAAAAFVAYRALHRAAPVASGGPAQPVRATSGHGAPFWPTTVEGRIGIGAFALGFVPVALVNVVQVAYLGWAVQLVALALTAVARFAKHDKAASVLIVFVLTAFAVTASLLFLAGEVFIGHD